MNKDTVIRFRASAKLRDAIESQAQAEQRTITAIIENAIYAYLMENAPKAEAGQAESNSETLR